jgi:hypothetical protein
VDAVTPRVFTPIVVVPEAFVVASPAWMGAFAIVATDELVELQCEFIVTSCMVPSLNVPVAVNCCVEPVDTEGFTGLTAVLTSVPVPTVSVVVPVTPNAVAEMVTLPAFFPCTIPDERTFANWGFVDFQLTFVNVAVLPSV